MMGKTENLDNYYESPLIEDHKGNDHNASRISNSSQKTAKDQLAINQRVSLSLITKKLRTKIKDEKELELLESRGISAEQQRIMKSARCLVRYNNEWRIYWDLFMMLLAIYNCFVIPLQISFDPPVFNSVGFLVINSTIDVLFAVDLVVMFRTTYIDSYTGEEIFNGNKIALNYIKGRFWMDLLATIPFDTIIESINPGSASEIQLTGILKLIRITRLTKIIAYMNVKEDVKMSLVLLKLCLFVGIYFHILGWFWNYLVVINKKWIPPLDYIYLSTSYYTRNTLYQYWMALYHAVLVEIANDIGPRGDTTQVIFWAWIIVVGAIVNSYFFGLIIFTFGMMSDKTNKFIQKLDSCNTAMRNLCVPKDLHSDVVGYLTYTEGLLASQNELETFLSLISPSLKERVIKHIFSTVLSETEMFKGRNLLIESLTRKLQTNTCQPEEIIINQGGDPDNLYFIARGGCNVYVRNRINAKVKVNVLKVGDIFGEVALINKSKRTATVKTNNYSTIAHLDHNSVITIFEKHPEAMQELKDRRKIYQDEWKKFLKTSLKCVDYLKNAKDEVLEELYYKLKEDTYKAGEIILNTGDAIDRIHLLTDGQVEVLVNIQDHEITIDTMYQGCSVGEYGVLNDWVYLFTCKAKSNIVKFSSISKQEIQKLIKFDPDFKKVKEAELNRNYVTSFLDFRHYRSGESLSRAKKILKMAILRYFRIWMVLSQFKITIEYEKILETIVQGINDSKMKDDEFEENSNYLLSMIFDKLYQISSENAEFKQNASQLQTKWKKLDSRIQNLEIMLSKSLEK